MEYEKKVVDKLERDYVVRTVDEFFNHDQDIARQMMERIWFRNILYYMGEQWMDWNVKEMIFRRVIRTLSLPTPVSNIIRDYVRSMKALILNKDFTVSVWPNSEDQKDVDAAKIGEMVLQHMDTANDEEFLDEKEKVSLWVVIAGIAFMRTFPQMDKGEWFTDANGLLLNTGEVTSQCVIPFSIQVDWLGETLKEKRAIGIESVKSREWVEDTFKIRLSTDKHEKTANYQKKLMKMVANVSPWKGSGLESLGDVEDDDMVLFREVEYKPDIDYPNGRFVATCCGKTIFAHDKLPIEVKDGKWEYTFTDYHYYYVPGRFWSDPGINDLISPQNTINQIDQALEINRKSLGKTRVILGSDMKIERLTKYGQHLMVLKYDALLSGGVAPQFDHGIPLPNQVLDERQQHRQVAQEAAGDPKNVMRGQAPSAQASGVMVDTLREAAEQGHYPDITRFYRSHKRTCRKRLILAKTLYTEERTIKVVGKGKRIEIRKFKGSDLRDNTDVRLELSSGISSTRSGQVQMFLKLIEAGFFSRESDLDPAFREELLRKMGLSGFEDKTNADVIRAQSENSLLSHSNDEEEWAEATVKVPKTGDNQDGIVKIQYVPTIFLSMADPMGNQENPDQPPEAIVISNDSKFKYDDHLVHFTVHRDFIIGSEFKTMTDDAQQIMIQHTDLHKQIMMAQMQEEADRQAAMQINMEGGQKPKQ